MNYQIEKKLYRTGTWYDLTITPVFPMELTGNVKYSVQVQPFSGLRLYGMSKLGINIDEEIIRQFDMDHVVEPENGALKIRILFPQEDRYLIKLNVNDIKVETIEIYALEEDLFRKWPYKGDHHMHTYYSDGTESPEYAAAVYRIRGLDYVAIADHNNYTASQRAKEFFEPVRSDFLVMNGEEVHTPDNHVHLLSIGGEANINLWIRENMAEYRAAVERYQETIKVPMMPKDRYAAAACMVAFDKIKSVGGVAVLCHPGWLVPNYLHVSDDLTQYLIDNRNFDAIELVNGVVSETSNQLQLSLYMEQEKIPIIGDSDRHRFHDTSTGSAQVGYSIVFAEELTADSIKDAIRKGYCVACYDQKIYGSYRLVKYALFLKQNIFAAHDALCATQGKELIRYAGGKQQDETFMNLIESQKNIVANYMHGLKAPDME